MSDRLLATTPLVRFVIRLTVIELRIMFATTQKWRISVRESGLQVVGVAISVQEAFFG